MMRRNLSLLGTLALVLAACGQAEVTVNVEVEYVDPETGEMDTRPAGDLVIQLVPFDRDAIFDSLTRAAPTPEPEIPAELQIIRDSIQLAQAEWRDAETEWLARRERLEQIRREMNQYSPAEAPYRQLFFEFEEQEARHNAAERRKDTAFARFDRLQQAAFADLESFRVQMELWEDEAFADYGEVVAEKLAAARREIVTDTTNASGVANFRVSPGEWWVHARYRLPVDELYWNVRITAERGEPVVLQLTPANAQRRDVF